MMSNNRGAISGAGGATVSGSIITAAVLSRKRRKAAEDIMKKYKSRVETLKTECVEIADQLKNYGKIEDNFPIWISFWAQLVIGGASGSKHVGWDIIARTIVNSMRLVSYGDDAFVAGARAGATVFKAAGSTTLRGLHIAGGVLGLLLMPVDIYTLVDSSLDLHKKNPHKVSAGIRKTVDQMRIECPRKDEVDNMIEEIFSYCA